MTTSLSADLTKSYLCLKKIQLQGLFFQVYKLPFLQAMDLLSIEVLYSNGVLEYCLSNEQRLPECVFIGMIRVVTVEKDTILQF